MARSYTLGGASSLPASRRCPSRDPRRRRDPLRARTASTGPRRSSAASARSSAAARDGGRARGRRDRTRSSTSVRPGRGRSSRLVRDRERSASTATWTIPLGSMPRVERAEPTRPSSRRPRGHPGGAHRADRDDRAGSAAVPAGARSRRWRASASCAPRCSPASLRSRCASSRTRSVSPTGLAGGSTRRNAALAAVLPALIAEVGRA